MRWSEATWDTPLFGFPVLQIEHIQVGPAACGEDLQPFACRRTEIGCRFVTCRLSCEQLPESMFLEANGFRFVETLHAPELSLTDWTDANGSNLLAVETPDSRTVEQIVDIARSAFGNERFHVDPRIPRGLGDERYANWVRSAVDHPTQELHALRKGKDLIGFFVTELRQGNTTYWHLNAIAPAAQGKGLGLLAWRTMIEHARQRGATAVKSSIVSRNVRVLALYAKLGFRFPPPQMTFHWWSAA
jgi:RimJ/RimL family protein N-acetyltransferase